MAKLIISMFAGVCKDLHLKKKFNRYLLNHNLDLPKIVPNIYIFSDSDKYKRSMK